MTGSANMNLHMSLTVKTQSQIDYVERKVIYTAEIQMFMFVRGKALR